MMGVAGLVVFGAACGLGGWWFSQHENANAISWGRAAKPASCFRVSDGCWTRVGDRRAHSSQLRGEGFSLVLSTVWMRGAHSQSRST